MHMRDRIKDGELYIEYLCARCLRVINYKAEKQVWDHCHHPVAAQRWMLAGRSHSCDNNDPLPAEKICHFDGGPVGQPDLGDNG